jgi:ankyrin repeat protein
MHAEAKCARERTPLHCAAQIGHVGAIKFLVQSGVDIEAKTDGGATAVHTAANNGQVEAIKVLVQLGAEKDAKNRQGATPLHSAAVGGLVEAITYLVVQLGVDKAPLRSVVCSSLWGAAEGQAA